MPWRQGLNNDLRQRQPGTIPYCHPRTKKAGAAPLTGVAPLITSDWNQDSPYNAMCPADASWSRRTCLCRMCSHMHGTVDVLFQVAGYRNRFLQLYRSDLWHAYRQILTRPTTGTRCRIRQQGAMMPSHCCWHILESPATWSMALPDQECTITKPLTPFAPISNIHRKRNTCSATAPASTGTVSWLPTWIKRSLCIMQDGRCLISTDMRLFVTVTRTLLISISTLDGAGKITGISIPTTSHREEIISTWHRR